MREEIRRLDLNSDVGESFGVYKLGMDEEIIKHITSANIACGFHAGDPNVMNHTVNLCVEAGVAVGAHPSFPDRMGFGRRIMEISPEELRNDITYQLGALRGFAEAAGTTLQHCKVHGALYNMAFKNEEVSKAVVEAVRAFDPNIILVAQAKSKLAEIGERAGLRVAREVFADRALTDDGNLVSRRLPGAVIRDPTVAARRVVRMVTEGKVESIKGREVDLGRIDTICVHGDTPRALELVKSFRRRLEAEAEIRIIAMGEFL